MRLQTPLDDIFRSPSYIRVLRALYHLPLGLQASAREIARRSGVSHPTASQALTSLTEQGIVTRRRAPRSSAFELRRTHTAAEELASLFQWEEELRQELIALLRAEIARSAPSAITAAYLFGSAAEGGMEPTSDIDVAVLHPAGAAETVTAAMQGIADRVQERFGNRLSYILSDAPLQELRESRREGSPLWRQIVRTGIPILEPHMRPPDG